MDDNPSDNSDIDPALIATYLLYNQGNIFPESPTEEDDTPAYSRSLEYDEEKWDREEEFEFDYEAEFLRLHTEENFLLPSEMLRSLHRSIIAALIQFVLTAIFVIYVVTMVLSR